MTDTRVKSITSNTIFLYLRMLVLLGVNLYTSRVILQALGVDDFGTYNAVAGVVVLFSFVNFSLVRSSQRFISYEIGIKGNVCKIFNIALLTHLALAVGVIIFSETIGLYVVHNHLNIPATSFNVAIFAYHFAILTATVQIVTSPVSALIIANEKMVFYGYLSVLEAIMKLGSAFLLLVVDNTEKLCLYSILIFLTALITLLASIVFSHLKCSGAKISLSWDKRVFREMFAFSSWNLLGGLGNMGAQQGISLMLNIFYGVGYNAALGIANQVTNAVYGFVSNFQTAYEPQIVKSHASRDYEFRNDLILLSSKFSSFLFLLIIVPLCLNIDFILSLWLNEVPPATASFVILMLVFLFIDANSAPLWITAQAIGNIRNYQIVMSCLLLMNIPFIYLCLQCGAKPQSVFIIRIVINIISHTYRLFYLKNRTSFSIRSYFRKSFVPLFCVLTFVVPVTWLISQVNQSSWIYAIVSILLIEITTIFSIWCFGMNIHEKEWIIKLVKEKLK